LVLFFFSPSPSAPLFFSPRNLAQKSGNLKVEIVRDSGPVLPSFFFFPRFPRLIWDAVFAGQGRIRNTVGLFSPSARIFSSFLGLFPLLSSSLEAAGACSSGRKTIEIVGRRMRVVGHLHYFLSPTPPFGSLFLPPFFPSRWKLFGGYFGYKIIQTIDQCRGSLVLSSPPCSAFSPLPSGESLLPLPSNRKRVADNSEQPQYSCLRPPLSSPPLFFPAPPFGIIGEVQPPSERTLPLN